MVRKLCLSPVLYVGLILSAVAADQEPLKDVSPLMDLKREVRLKPYVDYLCGDDVFLRPLFPTDHPYFRPIFTDSHVMTYFGNGQTLTPVEIEERIKVRAENNRKYYGENKTFSLLPPHEKSNKMEAYHWALITHSKVKGEGIAGILSIVIPGAEAMVELAYCIAPLFGGKGLTTKAAQLVLDAIPGNFVATVHPDNIGSKRVLEKLGFSSDPLRQGVKKYTTIRDYYLLYKED